MEQHAPDLLRGALWVIGSLGAVIALLLAIIAGIARWGSLKVLARMDEADKTMTQIRDLLADETRMLRDELHRHDVRLVKLEASAEQVLAHARFGRRSGDQSTD